MVENLVFRQLQSVELVSGYTIICQATDWLLNKGIQQWLQPLPLQTYEQRQAQGQNYGLFINDTLGVVVSLFDYKPTYWQQYLPDTEFMWLATLVTAQNFKGNGLGKLALQKAESYLAQQDAADIFLDCYYGDGFLPGYYTALGYEAIIRKQLEFKSVTFDSVLMHKTLRF